MSGRALTIALALFSVSPFVLALVGQDPQKNLKCEDVYANIKVFKGMPAADLIPAMEFMAASMKWECKDCHDTTDYTKETHAIETTRQMVLLQRDINEKWFNGRLEVTCMTCHNGEEHPINVPTPDGTNLRHGRMSNPPKPADLFAKHVAAAGSAPVMLTRTGKLTSPDLETGEIKTEPLEVVQAQGGKFKLAAGSKVVVSDGAQVTYGGVLMWGEPIAVFQRIGRTWWGDGAFTGLAGNAVSGKDRVGDSDVVVVKGTRTSTGSTEDLYFDVKTGLLVRMVNIRRTSVGAVVTTFDYEDYKTVDGAAVPMKVTVTFAGGQKWEMVFASSKTSATVDESLFKID